MKNKLSQVVAFVAMTIAFYGCSCNQTTNQPEISKQHIEENVREFVYPLPTAFEVTEMLNRIEAAYIQAICNDQNVADNYLTETKRALNLGVYSADLCYASTYNQQPTVRDYMNVISKLIDQLDMTNAVDPELPSKVEKNENDKEELTRLITDSFYDSYDYLNKNDRGPVSLLIVTGSWVEGLYITTHISEFTFDNKEMVKIVMSQKDPLIKLMELLEKYPGVESIDSIKASLQPLYEIYTSIDEGGISETQTESIKNAIDGIRNNIVAFE